MKYLFELIVHFSILITAISMAALAKRKVFTFRDRHGNLATYYLKGIQSRAYGVISALGGGAIFRDLIVLGRTPICVSTWTLLVIALVGAWIGSRGHAAKIIDRLEKVATFLFMVVGIESATTVLDLPIYSPTAWILGGLVSFGGGFIAELTFQKNRALLLVEIARRVVTATQLVVTYLGLTLTLFTVFPQCDVQMAAVAMYTVWEFNKKEEPPIEAKADSNQLHHW